MLALSVYSSKGGVGKSTVVANLAVTALAHGERVGVIDLDPQGSLCAWRALRSRVDVPVKACSPADLARNLDTERRRSVFDVVLIDTPPGDGAAAAAAVFRADMVLAPARPAAFDLLALSRTFEMIRTAGKRFGVVINGAPPTRAGIEAPLVRQARVSLKEIGARLWRHQITSRTALVHASANGLGVSEYEPDGPSAIEFNNLWRSVRHEADGLEVAA